MSNIKLNFVNLSGDQNNSDVVIFQKNVATDFNEIAVAWRVIQNCGHGCNHPFDYPTTMAASAGDSYGNYTPELQVSPGQATQVIRDNSGDVLVYDGNSVSPYEVEIKNNLLQGAISANIFKDGKLLATKTNVVPGQKGVFQFNPTIFIGVVSQIVEGDTMDSAIITQINTELSLSQVLSADIVMTGGGPGSTSTPFEFNLENVVFY